MTSGQETEWALFLQPRSPHRAGKIRPWWDNVPRAANRLLILHCHLLAFAWYCRMASWKTAQFRQIIAMNKKCMLDRAQNQWWSTGTCGRTKDIDDNTETKTEKMVETCVTPRLITKGRMKGRKKPGRTREMLLDWLTSKEYKMDYLHLKRMTEDITKWRQ